MKSLQWTQEKKDEIKTERWQALADRNLIRNPAAEQAMLIKQPREKATVRTFSSKPEEPSGDRATSYFMEKNCQNLGFNS